MAGDIKHCAKELLHDAHKWSELISEGKYGRPDIRAHFFCDGRALIAPLLDGATNEPAPEYRIANAGEFAAKWNTLNHEEREHLVIVINERADLALECVVEDHEGLKAEPDRLRSVVDKVKKYADDRHNHARTALNTLSSWRVWSDLYDILGLPTDEEDE